MAKKITQIHKEEQKLSPDEEKKLAAKIREDEIKNFISSNTRKIKVSKFDLENDFTNFRKKDSQSFKIGNYDYVPNKLLRIGYFTLNTLKNLPTGQTGQEIEYIVASAADLDLRKEEGKSSAITGVALRKYGFGSFENMDEILSARLTFDRQKAGDVIYVAYPPIMEDGQFYLIRFVRYDEALWVVTGDANPLNDDDKREEKVLSVEDKIIFKIIGKPIEELSKPEVPDSSIEPVLGDPEKPIEPVS